MLHNIRIIGVRLYPIYRVDYSTTTFCNLLALAYIDIEYVIQDICYEVTENAERRR